jgi:hypothetical protein
MFSRAGGAFEWTVTDLARAAQVSRHTADRFERGGSARAGTVEAIQRTLENARRHRH